MPKKEPATASQIAYAWKKYQNINNIVGELKHGVSNHKFNAVARLPKLRSDIKYMKKFYEKTSRPTKKDFVNNPDLSDAEKKQNRRALEKDEEIREAYHDIFLGNYKDVGDFLEGLVEAYAEVKASTEVLEALHGKDEVEFLKNHGEAIEEYVKELL